MSNHDGRPAARGPGHHEGDSPWPVDLGRSFRGPVADPPPSEGMTAAEFRTALANLHLTQRDYAARIRTNERTVRRWAAGDQVIPGWAVVILEFMAELQRHGIAFVD